MFYVKHVFLYKFSFANNLSCGGKIYDMKK